MISEIPPHRVDFVIFDYKNVGRPALLLHNPWKFVLFLVCKVILVEDEVDASVLKLWSKERGRDVQWSYTDEKKYLIFIIFLFIAEAYPSTKQIIAFWDSIYYIISDANFNLCLSLVFIFIYVVACIVFICVSFDKLDDRLFGAVAVFCWMLSGIK